MVLRTTSGASSRQRRASILPSRSTSSMARVTSSFRSTAERSGRSAPSGAREKKTDFMTRTDPALEPLYRQHAHSVLRRAHKLLGSASEAEEVLHEIFLKLVED